MLVFSKVFNWIMGVIAYEHRIVVQVLRHFWACFPPTTPDLAVKADKSLETLKGFHELKLKPFENQLARNYSGSGMNSPLTSHLNQMLDSAYRKHETWKQKKVKR